MWCRAGVGRLVAEMLERHRSENEHAIPVVSATIASHFMACSFDTYQVSTTLWLRQRPEFLVLVSIKTVSRPPCLALIPGAYGQLCHR